MIYIQHPRNSVIENVERMINCGDPSFGGAMYTCPSCGNFKYVPFRCHSRFCPTCGNMYSIDRTTSMSFKIIKVQHRHCVFTIARELGVQPFWQLPSSQTLQDKWLPSFSQNVDCFFNTSSASWASRNSRLRRAISFCSYSMMKMHFFCGRKT